MKMNSHGRVDTYFPFHTHTHYSLLDGFSTPEQYMQRCEDLGLAGFGITEHGNMYSAPYFEDIKHKYPNVKMVYGQEFYEAFDAQDKNEDYKYFHLVVLAKNENGRLAINRLTTKANLEENFYYKPRVDLGMFKEYANDLIVSSACLASKLAREKDYKRAKDHVLEYKSIFPNFYLEIQSHKSPDQIAYNKKILQLSKDTKTPFVITCDAHASSEQQLEYQGQFVKIAKDMETAEEIYEGCYLQSVEDIYETMTEQIGEENVTIGLQTTLDILESIDEVSIPFSEPILPKFELNGITAEDRLKELSLQGFKRRHINDKHNSDEYMSRLKMELDVINKTGYASYFLIVHDFVEYAISKDMPISDSRGCFTEDAMVHTKNGLKSIKDVVVGDHIVNRYGEFDKVLKTWKYDINEKMVEFEHLYGTFCKKECTLDHKILVSEDGVQKYKQAKDLKVNDLLVLPKLKTSIIEEDKYICQDDDFYYLPVESVKVTEKKTNTVYDLAIENDPSYLLDNCIVHNSAGGSLVLYLIGITNIDPLKYGLIFERFLNEERINLPDIDEDFADQQAIIDYLENKYGSDKVCRVLNFSYITPKVAIKDAGDVFGFPYKIREEISKLFSGDNFDEDYAANESRLLKYIDQNPEYEKWLELARNISGKIRQTSIHACAVGILNTPVTDIMPIQIGSDGEKIIQCDMEMVERLGIVKFDVLGVKTLKVVHDTLKAIGKDTSYLDLDNEEFLNNKATYDLIASGNTDGIFQIESYGMRDLFMKLKPTDINTISDGISLYRPDAMGFIPSYLMVRDGIEEPQYVHEDMEDILKGTYGSLIYQEQVLQIIRKFAGRTYGQADVTRRILAKKKKELVGPEADKLEKEIQKLNYSEEVSSFISTYIREAGGYSFNKSHGVGYATLTYKTAFLKANHPVEYMTSLLNSEIGNFANINKYVLNCKQMGIKVLPPDINKSSRYFTIHDGEILFGLQMIKGVGESTSEDIIVERNNGEYIDLKDFLSRNTSANKKAITQLIKAGAFKSDKVSLLREYCDSTFVEREFKPLVTTSGYTIGRLKEELGIDTKDKNERLELFNIFKEKEFNKNQKSRLMKHRKDFVDKYMKKKDKWEYNSLSIYLTANPFDEGLKLIKPFDKYSDGDVASAIGTIVSIDKKKGKSGQYAFIEFYNGIKNIELIFWANVWNKYDTKLKTGIDLAIKGMKDGEAIIVESVKPYQLWCKEKGI